MRAKVEAENAERDKVCARYKEEDVQEGSPTEEQTSESDSDDYLFDQTCDTSTPRKTRNPSTRIQVRASKKEKKEASNRRRRAAYDFGRKLAESEISAGGRRTHRLTNLDGEDRTRIVRDLGAAFKRGLNSRLREFHNTYSHSTEKVVASVSFTPPDQVSGYE